MFSNKVGLPDNGYCNSSIIDLQYKAANTNSLNIKGMEKNILMRYKFIECLVRISKAKYMGEADLEDKVPHAFERLMKEIIVPNF